MRLRHIARVVSIGVAAIAAASSAAFSVGAGTSFSASTGAASMVFLVVRPLTRVTAGGWLRTIAARTISTAIVCSIVVIGALVRRIVRRLRASARVVAGVGGSREGNTREELEHYDYFRHAVRRPF
jgi:hypothetical protein